MNYIELINQFWRFRRSRRISAIQADLYFFLLHECNTRNWQNPFEIPNNLLCASIGIAEPTLIDARNRLVEWGLIEVKAGKRNIKSPVYYLKSNLNKLSRTPDTPLDESAQPSQVKGEPNNSKPNQTKEDKNTAGTKRFIPPTLEEVTAYCKERGNNVSPERFIDFYTASGWMRGKTKMKDWRASVRTWENNQKTIEYGRNTAGVPDNNGPVQYGAY